jgi:myo-inositol-1(or 4)-monophosphatase
MGFIDVIVESALKPWDVQALIPIVENAGGVMTSWTGKPCADGGQVVACGDPALHAQVLRVLAAAG